MKKTLRTPSGTARILIIHDNNTFRSGLRGFLDNQQNIEVVGVAENGALAVDLAKLLKPEFILMDISMPGMAGPDVFRTFKKVSPRSKVVLVNVHDEAGYRDLARQMDLNRFISKRLLNRRIPDMLARLRKTKHRAPSTTRRSSISHHHA
jgi:DNA-binding NarL/FixJ family response regulator